MGNLDTGFASGLDATGRKLWFYSLPDSKLFETGVSVEEALELSGMNFHVGKKPLYRRDKDGEFVETPGVFEHYRTDNDRFLGNVGSQNTAFQNEQAFSFLQEMLGHGLEIRSAGTWDGGADVFITAQLPQGIRVEGADMTADMYALVRNNHAGKGALSMYVTPVDIRCNNMIASAIGSSVSSWKIRHTRTIGDRVHEATTALRLIDEYKNTLEGAIKQLGETEFELSEMDAFLAELTDAKRVQESIRSTYNESENLTRGNRWGVYSAVTEALDWNSPRRTGIETRAASQIDGPIARTRDRAMRMLLTR